MLDWIRTPVIGPGPLGNGVWRRVHDRFARSVRRYRTVIEVVPSRPVRAELAEIAEDLDEILELVREACEHAQAVAPSEGPDVPIGPGDVYLDVHRRLARAATLCSRASESAMMTRVAVRMKDADGVRDHIDAARRTVKQVREMVEGAVI
ncbi:hypothetical protein LWF15_16005 [Kineosporia rhizophila]|uniref:hypothetical protein n=1 Tax=Kineosporia TaxID=49184 RepID=UPI001E399207|nr:MULTISPECIES: hypothetical protein [Kineosporia]MCE0537006.1 hypothetical protein [Kineosporia rhizophila]